MRWASSIRNGKRSLERRWALYQALRRRAVSRRRATRPHLEVLEDRWLLSSYAVTSTADDGSAGTLRDAINQVNAGKYTEIDFNIGTSGSAQTINLTNQLPTLTASGVFLNGLTQGGSGNTQPLITLNGSGAGSSSDGLLLTGSNCIVSGLIIESFGNNGIEVEGSNNTIGGTATGAGNLISGNTTDGVLIDSSASGVAVQGNHIGVNAPGTGVVANSIGIEVAGANETIGGTTSGARNIISGNSTDGVLLDITASAVSVQGNYIGTDVTGNGTFGNSVGIEVNNSNNTIGGTTAGAGNLISGNTKDGVLIGIVSGVQVQGNFIGTNAAASAALANSIGIEVAASNNTIGGSSSGAGNVISGNSADGVFIHSGVSGVLVQGNYIGLDATGTKAIGNFSFGVEVWGSNDTIGGTATAARNIISGNRIDGVFIGSTASGVQVQGNFIGTDVTGRAAAANLVSDGGIFDEGSQDTIGGTAAGAGNIISGNTGGGIGLGACSGVLVQGNFIGTDVTGTQALANLEGIDAANSNGTIGGTSAAARNIISGNTNFGMYIEGNLSGLSRQGNYIGTDATGTKAVANGIGIEIRGSGGIIGGTAAGAGNLISGNNSDGVQINTVTGIQVLGNYIGTDVNGTKALGNGNAGVDDNGSMDTIGGTAAGERNILSGNAYYGVLIGAYADGAQVQGNYIGSDVTGTKAVANGTGVAVWGSNNTIGGTAVGARNIISGNSQDGVYIFYRADANIKPTGVQVQGNYIGTDVTGAKVLSNGNVGVAVEYSSNTIGGTTTGAGNIISGNSSDGVLINSTASGVTVQGNDIGTDVTGTIYLAKRL